MSEGSRAVLEQESLQSKEDYINSFLDRLEGETLGRMLDYLSSELEQSATQVRARDMLGPAEAGDTADTETQRQEEQEHIFAEIVKVTQSTVDRYLDTILLETVYTAAHEDTLQELGAEPGAGQLQARRASTGEGGAEREARAGAGAGAGGKERAAVKQRMKATQKKYLSAAHDQIWGMLDQFKQRGEVIITPSFQLNIKQFCVLFPQIVPENVKEIENSIRGSVSDIVDKDQVEVDLKKSVSSLDINWSV